MKPGFAAWQRSALAVVIAVLLAGCASSHPAAAGAAQGVDLHNTVCPVTLDSVGDSKLVETYQGKTYHFCCDDCPATFRADPAKYANAVAANSTKYGVKSGM